MPERFWAENPSWPTFHPYDTGSLPTPGRPMTSNDYPIRFGTDGWRAIIADDFTFANVRVAAQATADSFAASGSEGDRTVLIGYDVRFLSDRFAQATAEVFAGNGFRVQLMDRPYPTPYVSFEVHRQGLAGGIVITASHNPASFNGFKVKAAFGGSATPEITADIESRIGATPVRRGTDGIEVVGPSSEYSEHLRSLVDWKTVSDSGLRIIADPMHGSSGRLLEELLAETSCTVKTIRGEPDPYFGGVHPEPMMPQLEPLARAVVAQGAAAGLATDGDGDRLGVVDETGRFVSTLEVLPLLLLHAHRRRGWRGEVVHTFSQSLLVGRIAAALGLVVHETPIGFKNIARLMLDRSVLIGGEESGGIGLSRHLPERDGIFVNLLILDLLAATGRPLSHLIQEMWNEFGEFHYGRRDLKVPLEASARLIEDLAVNPPSEIAGLTVTDVGTLDGAKLRLGPDSWVLFRRSGTEPVLRVYSEAPTSAAVEAILAAGADFVEHFLADGVP